MQGLQIFNLSSTVAATTLSFEDVTGASPVTLTANAATALLDVIAIVTLAGGSSSVVELGDENRWKLIGERVGHDPLVGGAGNHLILGDDTAGFNETGTAPGSDLARGEGGNDTLLGDTDSTITNGARGANDQLYGGDGDDILVGDAEDFFGNDYSFGGHDQPLTGSAVWVP